MCPLYPFPCSILPAPFALATLASLLPIQLVQQFLLPQGLCRNAVPSNWNALLPDIHLTGSLTSFRSLLKYHLILLCIIATPLPHLLALLNPLPQFIFSHGIYHHQHYSNFLACLLSVSLYEK